MAAACAVGTFGGTDFWVYRVSVALASVLWSDFYSIQEMSRWVFIGFNAFIVFVGFVLHEIAVLLLNPGTGDTCVGMRPPRLPQFDAYAVSFYFTLTLINGLTFKSTYQFGFPRAAYIALTIALTPIGLRRMVAATLGEMYMSAVYGAAAAAVVFATLTFVFQRLADVYALERDAARLRVVGVDRFRPTTMNR